MLKACNRCGHSRPINGACPNCGYMPRRQLTTSLRGYGAEHQRRARMLTALAWHTPCPLCQQVMLPEEALDLDHSTPLVIDPHSIGDRIVHASCNRSAGARLAS